MSLMSLRGSATSQYAGSDRDGGSSTGDSLHEGHMFVLGVGYVGRREGALARLLYYIFICPSACVRQVSSPTLPSHSPRDSYTYNYSNTNFCGGKVT